MFEEPGRKLRRLRERLYLRYRDVEEASQRIAGRHGSDEFLIGLSRLADIENKGTTPSIYRLYSLCAIYGLDFTTALRWYGIELEELTADAAGLPLGQTRPVQFSDPQPANAQAPVQGTGLSDAPQPNVGKMELAKVDALELDPRKTSVLTGARDRWGKLPLALAEAPNPHRLRYAFIGTEDWTMYPVIPPGAFVQIDESRRRIAKDGWTNEYDRPVYLIEHRAGFRCAWCTEKRGMLVLQPHPLSRVQVEIFRYPEEADVLGQVVGVAMRLDAVKARRTRS
jgi:transcriptional regulator with XRE-family HTH domain